MFERLRTSCFISRDVFGHFNFQAVSRTALLYMTCVKSWSGTADLALIKLHPTEILNSPF